MSYKMPYPLLLAVRALSKPNHFYGTQNNLVTARTHAVKKNTQRFAVQRMLKRMEGR